MIKQFLRSYSTLCKQRFHLGLTTLEATAMLAISAASIASAAFYYSQSAQEQDTNQLVQYVRTFNTAAARYVSSQLSSSNPFGGLPQGCKEIDTVSSAALSGFLPSNFSTSTLNNNLQMFLVIRSNGTTNGFEAWTWSTGLNTAINGASGNKGLLLEIPTAVNKISPNTAAAQAATTAPFNQSWQLSSAQVTNLFSTAVIGTCPSIPLLPPGFGPPAPVAGVMASPAGDFVTRIATNSLISNLGNSTSTYLYRRAIPGMPELNTMHTQLSMNNNAISGANTISAQSGSLSNSLAPGGNLSIANTASINGNITASNSVSATSQIYFASSTATLGAGCSSPGAIARSSTTLPSGSAAGLVQCQGGTWQLLGAMQNCKICIYNSGLSSCGNMNDSSTIPQQLPNPPVLTKAAGTSYTVQNGSWSVASAGYWQDNPPTAVTSAYDVSSGFYGGNDSGLSSLANWVGNQYLSHCGSIPTSPPSWFAYFDDGHGHTYSAGINGLTGRLQNDDIYDNQLPYYPSINASCGDITGANVGLTIGYGSSATIHVNSVQYVPTPPTWIPPTYYYTDATGQQYGPYDQATYNEYSSQSYSPVNDSSASTTFGDCGGAAGWGNHDDCKYPLRQNLFTDYKVTVECN